MSLLERGNTRLAPLDTVEPDGYRMFDGEGSYDFRKEARKEVWLEAAEVCEAKADSHGWNYDLPSVGRELGAEFRRMAESDKTTMEGEK